MPGPQALKLVFRFGYVAKGVVYLVIGGLAAAAALGAGGRKTGSDGALAEIVRQPYGRVLLGIVTLGLFAYASWRLFQAWADPEGKGLDTYGLGTRGYYLVSGLVHASLGLTGARILTGSGGGGNGGTEQNASTLMAQPFGRWLVGLLGVIVIGVAVRQVYRAYKASFKKRLDLSGVSAAGRAWITRFGRFGTAARGVVYGIIGGFLVVAAWRASAGEARGLGGALATLEQQPYGWALLTVVALGLVSYGVLNVVTARYRRM